MSGGIICYCPVLGKKVEMIAEGQINTGRKFNLATGKGICQKEHGKCTGNCAGCILLQS